VPHVSDSRPGWGILATGGIAADFTRDLRVAGLHVAAVGSRTALRAEAFAQQHGIPHAHGSWQALAEDPTVDVVYVATPHPAHAAAARIALEHGKHVLVEKPFTLNEAEARDVIELAESRGLVALEAMWTRWLPHMVEIHQLLDSGAIGDPQLLIADHTQAVPTDPAHRMNAPELGGGALLDLGVYPVSFAHDLFGEPEDVLSAAVRTATGVDQRVSATFVHPGGAHSSLTTALNLAGPNRATILGTQGSIEIDAVWYAPTSFRVLDRQREVVRRSHPQVAGRGMQFQALELERLLRDGRTESERMTHEGTLAVMRTLDRIRASIGLVYPQESAG
jgi:predicted dehydrogenase